MSKMRNKKRPPKRVLALPDREPSKVAVLNRLTSKSGQRTYDRAITDFVEWYCSERARPSTALQNLSGTEAKRSDDHQPPGGRPSDGWLLRQLIRRVKGVRRMGARVGNWLTAEQGKGLLAGADRNSLRGKRSYAILATLIGGELLALPVDAIELRKDRWVIADLVGKAGHMRTVLIPEWVKAAIGEWKEASAIAKGAIFRSINKAGRVWGNGMTAKVLCEVVRDAACRAGIAKLAPHDLRRTCARLSHLAGGELDQIQFLLGHFSIQTTERYLGCKQKLQQAINDRLSIEPD